MMDAGCFGRTFDFKDGEDEGCGRLFRTGGALLM